MSNFLDKLFKGIDYLMGTMLGLMIIFVFLNVILRSFFNSGLTWSEEIARYLFIYITFLGAIGAMRANSHLGMDTVIRRLSQRAKRIAYIISQTLIFLLMLMLAHGSFTMTVQSVEARAAATGIPLSIIYGIGMLTAFCIAINCIANIFKATKEPNAIDRMVQMHESEEEDIVDKVRENAEDAKEAKK